MTKSIATTKPMMKRNPKATIIILILCIFVLGRYEDQIEKEKPSNLPLNNVSEINEVIEQTEFYYENIEYNFKVKVPKKLYKNCNMTINDGTMSINLKESDDNIVWIEISEEYEEQQNYRILAENFDNKYTIYAVSPTCGTLNDPNMEDLWSEMLELAKEIDENSIYKIGGM